MTDFNYRTNKKRFMYIAQVVIMIGNRELFPRVLFDFIGDIPEDDRIKFMEDKVKSHFSDPKLPPPTGIITHTQVGSDMHWKLGVWERITESQFDIHSPYHQVFRKIVMDSGDTTTHVKHFQHYSDGDNYEETDRIFVLSVGTHPETYIGSAFSEWSLSGRNTFEYDPDTGMYQDYIHEVWTQWQIVDMATHK